MSRLLEKYGISDVSSLPFATDAARISGVHALDKHREDEMRDAVARILTEHGLENAVSEDHVDWERVENEADELPGPDQKKLDTLRDRLERQYPSLAELTIDVDDADHEFEYGPGQFIGLHYHGTSRAYSLASSPNDDDLALCIRRVPGGRMTDDLLSNAEEGDNVTVRGPQGDFTLDEESTKDVAFLATGTGVAPLRGMIRYLYQEDLGDDRDVYLFLGTSWKDDLSYRSEFEKLDDDYRGFHFVPTLSRERIVTTWDGESNYVQETFLKYLVDDVEPEGLDSDLRQFLDEEPRTDAPAQIDPSNLQVYACGISAMVSTLEDVVHSVGVPDGDVYSEGFG